MKTFSESGLTFHFNKDWNVFKFDQHKFYNYLSGQGLKGVDFIGINWTSGEVFLMEVKNFNPINWKGPLPSIDEVFGDPDKYGESIIGKFQDTIYLFKIIEEYYQKKWWHATIGQWLLKLTPKRWSGFFDFVLWSRIYDIILNHPNQVNTLLYLEWRENLTPKQLSHFHEALQSKIEEYATQKSFSFALINKKVLPSSISKIC